MPIRDFDDPILNSAKFKLPVKGSEPVRTFRNLGALGLAYRMDPIGWPPKSSRTPGPAAA